MITAVATILGSILAYDFELRKVYQQMDKTSFSEYQKKNRFKNFYLADVNNFSTIKIKAANAISVSIEYGEKEAVWINEDIKELYTVTTNGNNLVIDLSEKGKEQNYYNSNTSIFIISPKISQVETQPFEYLNKITKSKEKNASKYREDVRTLIGNISQDSLILKVAGYTQIRLQNSKVKYLNTTVGDQSGDGNLSISTDNSIDALKLKAFGKSTVEILETDIKNVEYDVSDGAVVTFRGNILNKVLPK